LVLVSDGSKKESMNDLKEANAKERVHIALLGDSIFDNGLYVPDEPAVIDQLRLLLPKGSKTTLLAADGSVTADVVKQLKLIPEDVTHAIISSGGNDAIQVGMTLDIEGTAKGFLEKLANAQSDFRREYRRLPDACKKIGKPTVVCTIYDAIPTLRSWERTALSVFNDVIIREAFTHGFPVIDLREVCNESSDYSTVSPIEPSSNQKVA